MIVFGTAITDRQTYESIALPGIERVAEPDSLVLSREGHDSIQRPYNEMIEEAATLEDLEALVLLHQDLELEERTFPRKVRRAFSDSRVGLYGVLGARASELHLWLAPEELYGIAIGPEHRGSERKRISSGRHEVDGVDGAVLALAPWAVRGLRFDEPLPGGFHCYDVDIAQRVKASGGTLVCEYVGCCHHAVAKHDYEAQRDAGIAVARKWDPMLRPREWVAAFQR